MNTRALTLPGGAPASLALPALALALFCVVVLALGSGAVSLSPTAVLGALFGADAGSEAELVVRTLRLPRVLLGVIAGAGLGIAGAAMQGLMRNPLADPGLVGVSSGAALAAACVVVLGEQAMSAGGWLASSALPLAAFAGAALTTAVVYAASRRNGRSSVTLMLLSGIAINALAMSGIGLLMFMGSDAQVRQFTFWTLGSLAGATWPGVVAAMLAVALALGALLRRAGPLDALALGESQAAHLGVATARLNRSCVLLIALSVGATTALTGTLGFIGLIAPHLARRLVGPAHARLLPASALTGAALVVLADSAARTWVVPAELPIGVLTALFGAPFFIALLRRRAAHEST
ncbi:FecCD family ABC transporter permease [Methyloversatilis sp. MC4-4]|uniref:FecCD family ABC transporter permease n=1 Tax=Methyloversatilis sp. MC4-4 TaxID=3132824 RepID=UPI003CF000DD